MNNRRIGKTGLSVSEVGYGAWGIGKNGWIGASDDESLEALHRAIDVPVIPESSAIVRGEETRLIRSRSRRL